MEADSSVEVGQHTITVNANGFRKVFDCQLERFDVKLDRSSERIFKSIRFIILKHWEERILTNKLEVHHAINREIFSLSLLHVLLKITFCPPTAYVT